MQRRILLDVKVQTHQSVTALVLQPLQSDVQQSQTLSYKKQKYTIEGITSTKQMATEQHTPYWILRVNIIYRPNPSSPPLQLI